MFVFLDSDPKKAFHTLQDCDKDAMVMDVINILCAAASLKDLTDKTDSLLPIKIDGDNPLHRWVISANKNLIWCHDFFKAFVDTLGSQSSKNPLISALSSFNLPAGRGEVTPPALVLGGSKCQGVEDYRQWYFENRSIDGYKKYFKPQWFLSKAGIKQVSLENIRTSELGGYVIDFSVEPPNIVWIPL